jgi:predicted transcriptional regulator of viral defense system
MLSADHAFVWGIYTTYEGSFSEMAKPSSLTLAKRQIFAHFNQASVKVYSETQLADILARHQRDWDIVPSTRKRDFIGFLERSGMLKAYRFRAEEYDRTIMRYAWGEVSQFTLTLSLKQRGYLSHGTAAFLHKLIRAKPKLLHLNVEQSPKPEPSGQLSQESLARAFGGKQRQSKFIFRAGAQAVMIIAGKNSDRLGVQTAAGPDGESLLVTGLERTLIDLTVRPSYAGGIAEVLKAYRTARDAVSAENLFQILDDLQYVYPYHQAIGFLMQATGYRTADVGKLAARARNHDFYLTHGMKNPAYSSAWRLYYPAELQLPHGFAP